MIKAGQQKVREHGSNTLRKWQTKLRNDVNWGKERKKENKKRKKRDKREMRKKKKGKRRGRGNEKERRED